MTDSGFLTLLPIDDYLPELIDQLTKHTSLVLQAEPGAGKSTAVPLALLNADAFADKKIVMLEPRRVAAKSIAHYLSSLLGEKVGQTIGYQVRNEHKVSSSTRLEIVTEGVLTRRLQQDPELTDIGLVIFDEFHERSIHADLALMLCLEVQEAYRQDLRMLVMSATIDGEQIARYLGRVPVMNCPGRTHPVTVKHHASTQSPLAAQVIKALGRVLAETLDGDVLVFLPGQADIKRCLQLADESLQGQAEYLPLYGGLTLAQQERVLHRNTDMRRRVIFSTNIAETSLTIEGSTTVIDSGLEKVLVYDVKSGLTRLDTVFISQASAIQRAGRAGRLQAGQCVRLWSESAHNAFKPFQPEEITTAELTSLVLELSAWGITHYQDANWLTAPPIHHFSVACELNQSLGLVDADHKITPVGQKALTLGVEPRLACMMLSCVSDIEKSLACLVAALLSERDILPHAHGSDLTDRVVAIIDYINDKNGASKTIAINKGAAEQVKQLARNFANKINIRLVVENLDLMAVQQHIGPLLLRAFPDRLAKIRSKHSSRYLLANGRGVSLKSTDSVLGEEWLVVCDCDGKNKDGIVYSCVPISSEAFMTSIADKLRESTHFRLDDKKETVIGRRTVHYRSLTIREERLDKIAPETFVTCVEDIVREEGLSFINWTPRCQSWVARAKWLGLWDPSFPEVSEQRLLDNLDAWLLPYISDITSLKQLKQLDIYDLLVANLTWEQQQYLDEHAPTHYVTPSGKNIAIRYDEHQGPTVSVILQEMFGELASPKLAQGQVSLRFELLSPAKRPIQTTSDLGNFWRSSYFDVAKDMRGRYPKHRWPEKPLEEKAGRSIKRR
ncbi:ATP-dependent helicase HrpB [Thalassotalea fusca]